MPRITYISASGTSETVEVASGLSVMEGAIRNSVPGIDADCGGACACATCHVYIDATWTERLSPASAMETSMIEFAAEAKDNSRLSCQIKVDDQMDGLIVHLPDHQG